MSTEPQPFEQLTDEVRRQTASVSTARLEAQHARALASLDVEPGRPGRGLFWVGGLAAAAAAVLVLRALTPTPTAAVKPVDDALAYSVEGAQQGVAITANESPALMRFDEQQAVQVEQGSTAQVVRSTRAEVRVRLKTGAVTASVHSGPHRTWVVEADDVTVTALGTIFTVRWDPARSHLEVSVREGAVRVEGGPFRAGGLVVDPGHPLDFVGTGFDAGTLARVVEEAPVAPVEVAAAPAPAPPRPPRAPPTQALRRHVAEGRLDEAVTEFAAIKDNRTIRTEDIYILATHARRLRRADLAQRWFVLVRERAPGSPQASEAAYFLGRLAVDGAQDAAVARRWFEAAFTEAPSGTYAEESLGRSLELARVAKDDDAARRYAKTSLERWPRGLYAGLARAVLEGR